MSVNSELIEDEYYKRLLFYVPNKKQLSFHEAGISAQERLITGGNRSGKSFCGLIEMVMHLTGIYSNDWIGYRFLKPIRAWVGGKTASLIAETLLKDLLGDKEQNLRGLIHPSLIKEKKKSGNTDMYRTLYISHIYGGASKVTFKTFEEGREAFQGSKVDFVLLDEEPPLKIYQECKMRTMATDENARGMIVVCSTPLKGYSDFFNYFMDDRHPEEVRDSIWHAHITWDDANHLPEIEKKRLLAGMSPHEIEARTKGVPWPGSGLVYPVPESMIRYDPFEIPDYWPRVYGIDFGWHHPAFLFAAIDRDNSKVYFCGENSVPERTPEQHALTLSGSGIDWMPGVYDPAGRGSTQDAGKKMVELYRNAGFRNLFQANNSKEAGILKVLQMMQTGQILICSTLVKTLGEFRKYARDEDGIPNKKDDHLMDCMRYIIMSGMGVAIPKNFMDQQHHGRYAYTEPGYY